MHMYRYTHTKGISEALQSAEEENSAQMMRYINRLLSIDTHTKTPTKQTKKQINHHQQPTQLPNSKC